MHTLIHDRTETQDAILKDTGGAERLIEIGPSKVLSTMAQRTINRKFLAQDKIRTINRQLLSYSSDAKAIYYEYDQNEDQESVSEEADAQLPALPPSDIQPMQNVSQSPSPQAVTSPQPTIAKHIEDTQMTASDVVLTLIGQKLKRPLDEVSLHKSIRDQSGGKSLIFSSCMCTNVLARKINTPE